VDLNWIVFSCRTRFIASPASFVLDSGLSLDDDQQARATAIDLPLSSTLETRRVGFNARIQRPFILGKPFVLGKSVRHNRVS
jgi:hypothetical protein